ncbi:MAG: molecular chaperone DnaJ [Candidatus Micrarchaeota archaeon]
MAGKDYYGTLGVPRDATAAQVKDAYRKLAMQWHPDRNKSPAAEERFKQVSEAYAVLSDSAKRSQYDQYGGEGFGERFSQEDIFRNADFGDLFRQMGFGPPQGQSPFGSAFEDLFGGMRGGRGADLLAQVQLTLEEAAAGVSRELRFERTAECEKCAGTGAQDGKFESCGACNGTGQARSVRRLGNSQFISISNCPQCRGSARSASKQCRHCFGHGKERRSERISVDIPAGVDDGFRLRLAKKGNAPEQSGGEPGDLYVQVRVSPHEHFERRGADLSCGLAVPFATAALGGKAQVPTLGGKAEVSIAPGTQPGAVLRLKGKGVYDLRSHRHGDMLVRIGVEVPRKLSKRQRELLEEFGNGQGAQGKGFFKKIFK